jgi:uncharacterized protein
VKGVDVEKLASPVTRSPILVCGMPGSGYVGKLAADHLISEFGAKRVAEMRCGTFPPQALVDGHGVARPPKAELFYARMKGHDLLFFTADAQPTTAEGEYELAEAAIDLARKMKAKTVFTLAAYITGSFSKAPKVYGSATSGDMLESLTTGGVILMKEGAISGMNGLIIGMGALRGMKGACLLGETSGYVLDAAASEAVLKSLSKVTGVKIDTAKLKEKAEETRRVIRQLETLSEQSKEPQPSRARPDYIG